jgi:hypothetical protein
LREKGAIHAQISRLADRQFGHATRRQLRELGVPARTIGSWVEIQRLIPVHAGVYAVGHQQHTPIALAMAAVLACGDQAFLSHDSAAALWGVRTWPHRPEVSAPTEKRRPGIRTHRTTTLTTKEIRRHRNIRVTSPSRTILDIEHRLTDKQLTRAINDLRLNKHLKATELERLLSNSTRIRNLIDPAQNPTRSGGEDRFIAFCKEYGLPTPTTNTTRWGFEIDALFEAEKVIVEIDGWDFHKDRQSFESDRERDTVAADHGFLTVRLTGRRLDRRPAEEAARLLRILELRRRQAA